MLNEGIVLLDRSYLNRGECSDSKIRVNQRRGIRSELLEAGGIIDQLGVVYPHRPFVVPEPSKPSIALTESFSASFPQWPPSGSAFDEAIPHPSWGDHGGDQSTEVEVSE